MVDLLALTLAQQPLSRHRVKRLDLHGSGWVKGYYNVRQNGLSKNHRAFGWYSWQ